MSRLTILSVYTRNPIQTPYSVIIIINLQLNFFASVLVHVYYSTTLTGVVLFLVVSRYLSPLLYYNCMYVFRLRHLDKYFFNASAPDPIL